MTDKKYSYPEKIYLFPMEYHPSERPDLVWCETDESNEDVLAQEYVRADKANVSIELRPNNPQLKLDLSRLTIRQWNNFIENMDKSYFKTHMVDIVTGNDYLSDPKDLVILIKSDNKAQQVVLELNPSVFNLKNGW